MMIKIAMLNEQYDAAKPRDFSFAQVKANPLVLLTRHKTSSKEHGALRGGIPLSADSGQTFPLHSPITEKEKIRITPDTDF